MIEAASKKDGRSAQVSPASVAGYDALARRVPEQQSSDVAHFFDAAVVSFRRRSPASVRHVIAYTPVSWKKRPSEIQLLAFGREGERRRDVIEDMVPVVAEMMRQSEILPKIFPVMPGEWTRAVRKEASAYRHASGRGVLVFDADRSLAGESDSGRTS